MPIDSRQPIDAFLAAAAAKQPTPGGGAVAALVGATSAAIGEMVLNYSIGRKNSAPFDASLKYALGELTKARAVLLELLVEDQDAFTELQSAKKAPDDQTKAKRVADAVAVCIRVPQAISTTALRIIDIADSVVDTSNKWLLSDLAVCIELAMATLRSGLHNVRANLGEVDVNRRATLIHESGVLLHRAIEVVKRAMPRIEAIMAGA
ncbi:MAG: cyclodeaminase/cyclohydrolase family protein [Tepidisphaeraceae bacterium]